jgi:hypothetical protein
MSIFMRPSDSYNSLESNWIIFVTFSPPDVGVEISGSAEEIAADDEIIFFDGFLFLYTEGILSAKTWSKYLSVYVEQVCTRNCKE